MISTRDELLKTLRAVAPVVRALTNGLDQSAARRRPAPAEWSIVEVVAHMADADHVALDRIKRMLAEDEPELPSFDQAQWAIERRYVDLPLAPSVDRLAETLGRLESLLSSLDDPGWQRSGRHAEHGPMSVELYLSHVVAEDADHLAQIARLLPVEAQAERRPQIPVSSSAAQASARGSSQRRPGPSGSRVHRRPR